MPMINGRHETAEQAMFYANARARAWRHFGVSTLKFAWGFTFGFSSSKQNDYHLKLVLTCDACRTTGTGYPFGTIHEDKKEGLVSLERRAARILADAGCIHSRRVSLSEPELFDGVLDLEMIMGEDAGGDNVG